MLRVLRRKNYSPRSHEEHEAVLFISGVLSFATGFRLEDEKDGFVLFVASW